MAGFAANGGAGKTYNTIGNSIGGKHAEANAPEIVSRSTNGALKSEFGVGSLGYIAFKFTTANGPKYGYTAGTLTDGSFAGLAFNIQSVVLDNDPTDTPIPMGALPASVPEPSSLALSAIGALVMGAAGVRKWKQDKAAAKAAPLD
jgi:hypothetical protein